VAAAGTVVLGAAAVANRNETSYQPRLTGPASTQ
jgi:hypothetical protein